VSRIAVLGGGSWGTALAILLARSRHAHEISLWVHDGKLAEEMRRTRENSVYLPGHVLPALVHVRHELAKTLENAEIILGAVPAAHARAVYVEAFPLIARDAVVVSGTKGLEPSTHLRISDVIRQVVLGKDISCVAVLSGPSFAQEVVRGDPTAAVLAGEDSGMLARLQEDLAGPTFRLYANSDVLGVELGGAMKNVIAIAAGVCQGIGLGSNTLAALITRGLAEMTRMAVALGARAETLSGLAGLGDLVLTCTGNLSRNRYVGVELGKGCKINEILAEMRMVAEGVGTTSALMTLAQELGVELPITEQVNALLYEGKSPNEAIRAIMERPQKRE
jgi:glycerol-3-phosphate dehydrogenase (NAD(P)+)